jgi:methionine synthase II (cobalamin-independent)
MFATLLGALPRPPLGPAAPAEALIEAAVRAQEAAGLEPIGDGGFGEALGPVAAWQVTARLTARAVKQALIGPYTAGGLAGASARERSGATLARAATLNALLRDLAAAGCPLIEIHEPAATRIGDDLAERALFREAQQRLLDGVTGTHLSLAITGGNGDAAGIETLLAAPYASLAVDLIAGADNWRLVVATPGDRGIVCGALPVTPTQDGGPETLIWAAAYAASTGGRGTDRVGLATASSLAHVSWEVALRKIALLGEAARLAGLPAAERVEHLDPRAVSIRRAALGHGAAHEPPPPSRGASEGHDAT